MPRSYRNRLNDLDPKSWLKFQKSWFVHNPPPRRKDVLRHPAKFPETLAQEFIEFFTRPRRVVLDPMAGTGSALAAALRAGRNAYGIELNPAYAAIARQVVAERARKFASKSGGRGRQPGSRGPSRGMRRRSRYWPSPSSCSHRLCDHLAALLEHAASAGR